MEPLFSSSCPEGRTVLTIRTGDASTTAYWSFLWQ